MKELSAKTLCCNYRLYKVGLLIGFLYLIPNLIIVVQAFGDGCIYPLIIMCAVTVLTSLLLIKGLLEENHHLLLPWMVNVAVLIIFSIILFMLQFHEFNKEETKKSAYLQFGFFICLELQIIFWYVIYYVLMRGYQKSKIMSRQIKTISQIVEPHRRDYFIVSLTGHDHLIGDKNVACV